APLRNNLVPVQGTTDPENKIVVNGKKVVVESDGRFSTIVDLPRNKKSTILVEVVDPEGFTGSLEREFEVQKNDMFLLAFADGEVGTLRTSGFLEGANQSKKRDYYSEGRIAYYFKGVVLGKYLVTSAFDTGKREFKDMFTELDRSENDRLLTNLDPDKYYPVYGDSSTIVYDAESQGRFYLAVDSDEFHLLVGDFPVGMTQTELAAYNRTLYGGKIHYRSLASTRYGAPLTEVTVFGAEVRTVNSQNQFLGTGGSLYYLSHDRIIEGSEQVRIEVRDKDTGVILSSTTQEQNIDYQIKYEEGRLFFQRPIPSVSDDLTDLLDRDILEGNPVFVVVDFEYESGFFEDNVNGGHVRQQIGDHLAFGGTVVREEEGGEEYELGAGDIEVRVGEGTRILGEYARSRGAGSDVEFSPDGGLTFTPVDPGVSPEGRAYKTSIEADLGELFGKPNRFLLNGYLKELGRGYSSNGSVLEEGTRKAGVGTTIRAGEFDTFNLRYEGQRLLNNGNFLSQSQVGGRASYMETFQWIHDKGKLRLTGEYQARQLHSSPEDIRSQAAAARIDYRITGDLIVHFEQQSTLQGPAKNKTTVGARYSIGRYRLFGEGSTGTMGEGLRAGLSTEVGETGLISVSQLITRDAENGRSSQTILHGENRVGTGTRVYSEYQLNRSDKTDSDVSLMGITQRWEVSEGWVLNFLSEVTRLDQDGDLISRATAGAGLNLEMAEQLRLNDYLEVR
ncbi:MAG TPA: hypothetical protein VLB09_02930, partial [Nitrospiria bacterium]|nr:hypothetical protein [Nitrospiria bacterium]